MASSTLGLDSIVTGLSKPGYRHSAIPGLGGLHNLPKQGQASHFCSYIISGSEMATSAILLQRFIPDEKTCSSSDIFDDAFRNLANPNLSCVARSLTHL